MSGKRKKDYVAVFSSILQLLNPTDGYPKVQEFLMDCEAAMWQVCMVALTFYHYLNHIIILSYFIDRHARPYCRRLSRLAAHFTLPSRSTATLRP
jgi:hypothetical protein